MVRTCGFNTASGIPIPTLYIKKKVFHKWLGLITTVTSVHLSLFLFLWTRTKDAVCILNSFIYPRKSMIYHLDIFIPKELFVTYQKRKSRENALEWNMGIY